jgi:hypothetical protein
MLIGRPRRVNERRGRCARRRATPTNGNERHGIGQNAAGGNTMGRMKQSRASALQRRFPRRRRVDVPGD